MSVFIYMKLMEKFLNHAMSFEEFEKRFLNKFRVESVWLDDELFKILNEVFEAIDFCRSDFSELILRKKINDSLRRLELSYRLRISV
ncbi:colicin immunity domain-containing protein [Fictibacillus sp. NPDC058756]|uniref:colicin immunity domain-containing protein n=1 Tax=Fictibacillus sp. NPDC058756 TaxID=3346625 RepID=UPI0036906473